MQAAKQELQCIRRDVTRRVQTWEMTKRVIRSVSRPRVLDRIISSMSPSSFSITTNICHQHKPSAKLFLDFSSALGHPSVSPMGTLKQLHCNFYSADALHGTVNVVIQLTASGVLGGIRRISTFRFFWQCILTSVIINKQSTFRPFATPLCVYPPPFLALHHCWQPSARTMMTWHSFLNLQLSTRWCLTTPYYYVLITHNSTPVHSTLPSVSLHLQMPWHYTKTFTDAGHTQSGKHLCNGRVSDHPSVPWDVAWTAMLM